jgi:SAM-dependent methyltransferase
MIAYALGALAAWELGWWAERRDRRSRVFAVARAAATRLGRPLVVIGAPDGGVTAGYGCGDVTVDLRRSTCPNSIVADVTVPGSLPFADNSVVVFCSCVLEYAADAAGAIREIERVSGGWAYYVGVEPWTLAAVLYPGAKRTLPPRYR